MENIEALTNEMKESTLNYRKDEIDALEAEQDRLRKEIGKNVNKVNDIANEASVVRHAIWEIGYVMELLKCLLTDNKPMVLFVHPCLSMNDLVIDVLDELKNGPSERIKCQHGKIVRSFVDKWIMPNLDALAREKLNKRTKEVILASLTYKSNSTWNEESARVLHVDNVMFKKSDSSVCNTWNAKDECPYQMPDLLTFEEECDQEDIGDGANFLTKERTAVRPDANGFYDETVFTIDGYLFSCI